MLTHESGMKGLPTHLITGLKAHKELESEIDAFIRLVAAKAGVKEEL
jgi:hypothetical protein